MMVDACGIAEFTGRDLHPVTKVLAIAVLAIERQPDRFNRRPIRPI